MIRYSFPQQLDRPFPSLLREFFGPWGWRKLMELPVLAELPFTPPTEVFAQGDDLVIKLELPGIDPAKDVAITYEEGVLHVTGERKQGSEVTETGYYSREFTYGSFERQLPLPAYVTAPEIKATYEGGVLQIVITGGAKTPTAPPASKIPVTVPTPSAKS